MSETELKLHGTPARLKAALARLGRTPAGGAVLKKGPAFRKTLRAVYFDTAKDDLHAKGLSLRVREEDGRFIQTLKQETAGEALTRGEWSDPVSAAAPELLNTASGRKLRRLWKDVRLLPRFRTEIVREGFVLGLRGGAEVEVVRDEGEIRAVGRDGRDHGVTRVSEIELELKKGSPAAVLGVALQILAAVPVRIEARGKSDRGYALLAPGAAVAAVKAEAPKVRGRETLAEALRAAARSHFAQFLANMPGALAHDADSIHQMRVAMRRLRSALYAVRHLLPEAQYESARVKLKHLLQSLGAARDWEVLTGRMAELDDVKGRRLVADAVRRAAEARKRRVLARAVSAVGSPRNTRAVLEAMLWFETLPGSRHARRLKVRARDAAGDLLSDLFGRVRRRARRFERQSVDERHRLRIACKNLRYTCELFAPFYARRKVREFLALLRPVQEDLGHLNDVSRARDLLGGLARRPGREAAAVIARLEQRVGDAEKRARRHVAALRAARPFW